MPSQFFRAVLLASIFSAAAAADLETSEDCHEMSVSLFQKQWTLQEEGGKASELHSQQLALGQRQANHHASRFHQLAYTPKSQAQANTARAKHDKPVVWIHLHKVGGTAICNMAGSNGEIVISPSVNCNWLPSDDVHTVAVERWTTSVIKLRSPISCDKRREILQNTGFTWSHIEREINEDDLCPEDFHYATMLRDPVAHAQSMVNFMAAELQYAPHHYTDMDFTQYGVYLNCFEAGAETCPNLSHPHPLALWIYFDNPVVRMLGGTDILRLPPMGITSSHAQMVIDRLSKFDAVFILEMIDFPDQHQRLTDTYGWLNFQALASGDNTDAVKKISFSDDEKARIQKLNMHDYAVYNHFKQVVEGM
jgi:hypothetical protein